MGKLFKQVIKNHHLDLIEFYGVILIMVIPFMVWYFPKWSMEVRILYLGVVQFSIFMGLVTRFTRDLLSFTTNIQYCLAPIKQGRKILAPLLFYVINFIIADLLVLFFVRLTHAANLAAIAVGFGQLFILSFYVLLIVIFAILFSLTIFNKSRINLPVFINDKITAKQLYSFLRGLIAAIVSIATVLLSQALGKILVTPLFIVSIPVSNYISNSSLKISINTLPYLLLGLVYIYFISVLSSKNAYLE